MPSALSVIGNYHLLEPESSKEGVALYRAVDVRQERLAAVKIWPLKKTKEDLQKAAMVRFQMSVAVVSRLDHPHIAPVYEAGRCGAGLYLAREWVEGETLRKFLLRRGPLSLEEILPIIEQIGTALDYAHELGVTHGHLHPDNLFLTPSGHVYVTDFSLAEGDFAPICETLNTSVYLSPEQIQGNPPDARSDIFALGVIVYEALTGQRPIAGQHVLQAAHSIQHDPPAPLIHLPHLQPVFARALEQNPDARYERVTDFLSALQAASRQNRANIPSLSLQSGVETRQGTAQLASQEQLNEDMDVFTHHAVVQGVSGGDSAASPLSKLPPDHEQAPASGFPLKVGAAGLTVGVVALLFVYFVSNRANRSTPTPASAPVIASAPAPRPTTSWRFQLPESPSGWLEAEAEVDAPAFILSDFEQAAGGWEPDRRQLASSSASVSRIRDRAQQGSYWLKMSGVSLAPGVAQEAAFSIHPDAANLSRHGSTISASLFLPRNAPEGLRAGWVIVDREGKTHSQEKHTPLLTGRWTTLQWEAGPLLTSVDRLKAVVYASAQPYTDYIGLDNVQVRDAASSPLLTGLTATLTPEGRVQIGNPNRLLTRFGLVLSVLGWQMIVPALSSVQKEAATNTVILEGTFPVPGLERDVLPFKAIVRAVDSRVLEMEFEVTPTRTIGVGMLALEAQLPCAIYQSTSVDMIAAQTNPVSTNLPVSARANAIQIASDFPSGFKLSAETPTVFRVSMETVATTFVYTAARPLNSVNLAGDFNGWNMTSTPMKPAADGRTWSVSVPLIPGERQYKFVLNNGEWITDPRAVKNIRDSDGNINSVRLVLRDRELTNEPIYYLWAMLAGSGDGTPVNLGAGKPLRKRVRLTYNQPFENEISR